MSRETSYRGNISAEYLLAKEFLKFASVCRKSLFIYEENARTHRGMLVTREGRARRVFTKTVIDQTCVVR